MLLAVRLVQRSTVQFVVNALVGIGIGYLFVTLSARNGGSAEDQALAYFLPGILYNPGYSVLMAFTCLIGWPLVGFMVGSVTGDPTAWHKDRRSSACAPSSPGCWCCRASCARCPGADLARRQVRRDGADTAVAVLGISRSRWAGRCSWPPGAMVWLLGRNHTPITPEMRNEVATPEISD